MIRLTASETSAQISSGRSARRKGTQRVSFPKASAYLGRISANFHIDPAVTDFYAFTRDSFSLEGYAPAPFDGKIPVAI